MFFYAFNVAVIVGVGFLLVVLRFFVREARPRHAHLEKKSQGIAQPVEVLKSRHTRRMLAKG
jgi:hypothetical protein